MEIFVTTSGPDQGQPLLPFSLNLVGGLFQQAHDVGASYLFG